MQNNLFQKIEALVFTKYIDDEWVDNIHDKCLDFGLKGINVTGTWLPQFAQASDRILTYVNIDCPFSQNDLNGRIALIRSYQTNYQDGIDGVNIGPSARLVNQADYDGLNKEFAQLKSEFPDLNLRLMMNLPFYDSDEQVLRISSLAINNGFAEAIVGSTHKDTEESDIIMVGHLLKKHLSNRVSVFGNFYDQTLLARSVELFNSTLLSPLSLFNLILNYEKSV